MLHEDAQQGNRTLAAGWEVATVNCHHNNIYPSIYIYISIVTDPLVMGDVMAEFPFRATMWAQCCPGANLVSAVCVWPASVDLH